MRFVRVHEYVDPNRLFTYINAKPDRAETTESKKWDDLTSAVTRSYRTISGFNFFVGNDVKTGDVFYDDDIYYDHQVVGVIGCHPSDHRHTRWPVSRGNREKMRLLGRVFDFRDIDGGYDHP